MSDYTSEYVNKNYSIEKTETRLNNYYSEVLKFNKKKIDFKLIFGDIPDKWFLSCQTNSWIYNIYENTLEKINENTKHILHDPTNGSIHHFCKYFPENEKLKEFENNLNKNYPLNNKF